MGPFTKRRMKLEEWVTEAKSTNEAVTNKTWIDPSKNKNYTNLSLSMVALILVTLELIQKMLSAGMEYSLPEIQIIQTREQYNTCCCSN